MPKLFIGQFGENRKAGRIRNKTSMGMLMETPSVIFLSLRNLMAFNEGHNIVVDFI